jgi:hypothetical protein
MGRWLQLWESLGESLITAALFAAVGVSIGVGKLMASGEPLSARLVIGRAISTGGIAMAAGAVLVWVPGLSLLGQIGVAAALASLGVSGLERIFARVTGAGAPSAPPTSSEAGHD